MAKCTSMDRNVGLPTGLFEKRKQMTEERKKPSSLAELLKTFCTETSLHGWAYLASEERLSFLSGFVLYSSTSFIQTNNNMYNMEISVGSRKFCGLSLSLDQSLLHATLSASEQLNTRGWVSNKTGKQPFKTYFISDLMLLFQLKQGQVRWTRSFFLRW